MLSASLRRELQEVEAILIVLIGHASSLSAKKGKSMPTPLYHKMTGKGKTNYSTIPRHFKDHMQRFGNLEISVFPPIH